MPAEEHISLPVVGCPGDFNLFVSQLPSEDLSAGHRLGIVPWPGTALYLAVVFRWLWHLPVNAQAMWTSNGKCRRPPTDRHFAPRQATGPGKGTGKKKYLPVLFFLTYLGENVIRIKTKPSPASGAEPEPVGADHFWSFCSGAGKKGPAPTPARTDVQYRYCTNVGRTGKIG